MTNIFTACPNCHRTCNICITIWPGSACKKLFPSAVDNGAAGQLYNIFIRFERTARVNGQITGQPQAVQCYLGIVLHIDLCCGLDERNGCVAGSHRHSHIFRCTAVIRGRKHTSADFRTACNCNLRAFIDLILVCQSDDIYIAAIHIDGAFTGYCTFIIC